MWHHLAALLRLRLTPGETAFLAISALAALDDDDYRKVNDFMEGSA